MSKEKNPSQSSEETGGKLKSESEVSTEQLLELADDELKEKYGIEDPKNWKSYQRALHKEQRERTEEREKFQNILDERDTKFNNTLNTHKLEIEALKPKPKGEELVAPVYVDTGDPEDEIKFIRAERTYDIKVAAKANAETSKEIQALKDLLTEGQQVAEEQRNLEMVKSTSKGIWMQEEGGSMSLEEAEECWNWQNTVKADDRIKSIGKLFKLSKGDGGSELAKVLKEREGLKLEGAAPGAGAGGGASEEVDPTKFTKTADHTDIYKTK